MSEERTGSGLAQGPLPTGPPRSGSGPAGQEARLCPEMASFRALVLDFVRDYIARWGQSPSYGEIAAGLASNRTRVKRALRSLELAGLLLRTPGTRGLALPDDIERARLTLERAGLLAPGHGLPVTNPTLLPPAALDYPATGHRAKRGKRRNGNGDSSAT